MGSRDLVERIRNLTSQQAKLSPNRGSNDVRYFLNVDDRTVEQWLDLIEAAETPISVDFNDFKA